MLALLGDTVAAAVQPAPRCAAVLVVTDEPRPRPRWSAGWAPRRSRDEPDGGLNPPWTHGAEHARRGAGPVAALSSDLPALRPGRAGRRAGRRGRGAPRASSPTPHGTGTTLLAVARRRAGPAFGPGSAAAHTAGGAVPLDGDWPGLRQDVDTAGDLRAACRLGVGPRTSRFLAGHLLRHLGEARIDPCPPPPLRCPPTGS